MGKIKWDLLFIILITLLSPLFFYKLGQTSLGAWDEAWYADISRNILQSGDIFNLKFNGNPYLDHPPAGFWLTAISFKLLEVSEFSARLPQAFLGFISLIVVYLLGKELFNRAVGFASALAFSSSIWFLYRARSGNLDITLTFFFLLTLLLALKASKQKLFLVPFSISFSLLMLSKTMVPITIIPALILVFWKAKLKAKDLIYPALIFLGLFGSWILVQILNYEQFIRTFFHIGLPGVKVETNYLANLLSIKEYLHSGIGKWFWPGLLGIFVGLLLRQKRFYILSIFFITFFAPFLFSTKGHIWHLVPLHPIMILAFFGTAYVLLKKFISKKEIVIGILIIISSYISFNQIKMSWYQFIDTPPFVSDQAILSREASKYPYKLYFDGHDIPAIAFYSGKKVYQATIYSFNELSQSKESYLLITDENGLKTLNLKEGTFEVLKKDRDRILILKK